MALATVAVRRNFQRRGIDVGHPCTHALAARLVVNPEHGKSCALQHVHQRLEVTAALFMAVLAQVREHAGQRSRSARAAGPGVAHADDVFAGQPRCGVAFVAVDAEIARAGRFTDHHDQCGWWRACRQRQARILSDGGHLPVVPLRGNDGQIKQGIHAVEGVDLVAQLGVVAHERGEILKHQEGTPEGEGHTAYTHTQVCEQLAQHRAIRHWRAPQPRHRGDGQAQHRQQQLPTELVACLTCVGLKHIDHHRCVHHDAVHPHVIGGKSGQQQQQ